MIEDINTLIIFEILHKIIAHLVLFPIFFSVLKLIVDNHTQ